MTVPTKLRDYTINLAVGGWLKVRRFFSFFFGFLPCGLVYTALAGAAASGDIIYGGIFMLLFGLGTIPALVILSIIGKQTKINWQALIKKALPAMALILGCLLILRGLSLGIPYISPDLSNKTSDKELFIPHHH